MVAISIVKFVIGGKRVQFTLEGKCILKYKVKPGGYILCSVLPNGTRHGEYHMYSLDGTLLTKYNYTNGFLHGQCYDYFPSGQLMSMTTYYENEVCGLARAWYPNGQLKSEKTWDDDGTLLIGDYKSFYENGKPWENVVYSADGIIVYKIVKNEEGEIVETVNCFE